ncbi:MAG: NADH-quinone oxidoreductase subunit N [Deferribacterales bacterium]|jgi:NADH-quinone oxidoreductase subunit N|uniref:NADH-quinone oxidoreductase subunit N n=1 Tax=Deferrivibrio essentukiensis TaxID=2880922 RepID=UPI0019BBA050|nr:NADH-quinone oxidoreductase subunit N [Deferrivibrio essentukiensis]MBC7195673.1 NADH-quinone oxidoreductase subunit N [Deferribacterales bacterium]MCB4203686.1 NADH-quinone oxidoreductase subunit N [Deferrivibrio essentukiensis]
MGQSIVSILPEILMTIFGLMLIVIDVMSKDEKKSGVGYFGIAFILLTLLASVPVGGFKIVGFDQMLVWDSYAYAFFIVFAIAYILTTLGSVDYLKANGINKGEYYTILYFSIIGMMFMVSATDLSVLYLGLETMAIAMYIMAGFNKKDKRSNEAGIKYFIIGAFSSGILLYGLTYVYGYTGSTKYSVIAEMLRTNGVENLNIKLGLVMMLAGFAFKISAVPFHMWAPDVYSGAPTPVTGFMTVAPKAAAFGALIRFVMVALEPASVQWQLFFSILAVLTMTYGNLVAIAQNNVKRMLAYSAISHAGYMLIGLVAANDLGYKAIALYMIIYGFMNIGAFTILGQLKNKGIIDDERLESFAGLSKKHPLASLAMLIFMFSLAGIPPLAGFVGKFYIFSAAIKSGLVWLAIVGVVNSAIACYYYMRVTIYMYFKEAEYDASIEMKPASSIATFIAVVFVLLIGVFPSFFINIVKMMLV